MPRSSTPIPSAVLGLRPQASVLVVDDNAGKRLALKSIVAPLGYEVVEAESGLDALRCVLSQDFAVILMDVHMPEMDGLQTAGLIRQRLQSAMTPIIFITASRSDEIAGIDRYAQGAVDFIFAPVDQHELQAKVSVFANLFTNTAALAKRTREVQAYADEFKLLADVAPIGIFRTDSDDRYEYTNPRWSEITGVPGDVARGRPWDSIISASQRSCLLGDGADDPGFDTELSYRFDLNTVDDGVRVVVVTSKSTVTSDGVTRGRVGTLADVTVEARAEAALSDARDKADAATRLKSDFLANMSHEIRTPMNGVIGMTELLLETDLNAKQRDYAETVSKSGQSLLVIINDILDFSKIEAETFEIEDIDFEVRSEIEDVTNLLVNLSDAKDLTLKTVVEDSVPHVVRGDPVRVGQVLTNFVQNAIKFTNVGAIDVRVTAQESGGSSVLLRYEVTDSGIGIEAGKLALIFEPFVQGDTSTSRRYGGTGLGLAICHRLVTLMGGECGVTSQLGQGSTFWFTVSTVVGAEKRALPDPVEPTHFEDVGVLKTRRLLVAEDNRINQKVILAMLSESGCQIDVVGTGAEAIRAASLHTYDAILMDCQMPELNGFEATTSIRANELNSDRRTLIIAITAGARAEDRERCLAVGMDDCLTKPIRKDVLLATIGRYVSSALDEFECIDDGIDRAIVSAAASSSGDSRHSL